MAILRRWWRFAVLAIGVGSLLASLAAVAVVKHHRMPARILSRKLLGPSKHVRYVRAVVVEQEIRKVYPYSIVPGGAETLAEAKLIMNRPELHATYADVDLNKLHQTQLEVNLTGYVSYRYQDKIYWTARKLTLRAGETVFTDGTHIVRGRCLNRYSALPMSPLRPKEPSPKVMDTPVDIPVYAYKFPLMPVEEPTIPEPPEELTPTVPVLAGLTPASVGTKGGFWFPLIPIIPPIHRHRHRPPPPGVIPPPPPIVAPVAVVPEPSYFWLLLGALVALVLAASGKRLMIRLPTRSSE